MLGHTVMLGRTGMLRHTARPDRRAGGSLPGGPDRRPVGRRYLVGRIAVPAAGQFARNLSRYDRDTSPGEAPRANAAMLPAPPL